MRSMGTCGDINSAEKKEIFKDFVLFFFHSMLITRFFHKSRNIQAKNNV